MINDTMQHLLNDTLGYLQTLARANIRPDEAQPGLRQLAQRYPDTPLDLVWVEEPYDGSIHYDALVQVPGEGTVSLSFCREQALPWPLRGVQRWRDQDLVRVNDTVLTVDHAIACLDFVWDEARIVRRLVDVCLIQAALQREPIALSDADVQRAMDGFRRARGLLSAEATHRWMADNGVTPEKLERLVSDEATLARLRQRVAGDRIDDYFATHRDDLARIALMRLDFPRTERALAAFGDLRDGAEFGALARRYLAEAVEDGGRPPALASEIVYRSEVAALEALPGGGVLHAGACPLAREAPPDLASALFEAEPGAVVGPVRSGPGAALLQVVAVGAPPSSLDGRTREHIERRLFEEWLDEQRRAARIDWYWGTAAQAGPT